MKFSAIAVLATASAFDITASPEELTKQFEMRLTELIDEDNFNAFDEAMAHIDVMTAIDEGMAHIDVLSAVDEAMAHVEVLSAVDEAMAHIDVLSAIDEAMAHIDVMNAIDEGMAHINMLETQAKSGSTSMTAIIASAGALLAIGGGFFIKSKFSAAQVKDECESLL